MARMKLPKVVHLRKKLKWQIWIETQSKSTTLNKKLIDTVSKQQTWGIQTPNNKHECSTKFNETQSQNNKFEVYKSPITSMNAHQQNFNETQSQNKKLEVYKPPITNHECLTIQNQLIATQ